MTHILIMLLPPSVCNTINGWHSWMTSLDFIMYYTPDEQSLMCGKVMFRAIERKFECSKGYRSDLHHQQPHQSILRSKTNT